MRTSIQPMTTRHLPHCRYSRVSARTALAFPEQRAGRCPHLLFRGLLKLHACYGLRICSPTIRGLCHEAAIPPVHPTKRPVSYPVIPTTPGVGLPPTGNLRLRGAPLLRQKTIAPIPPRPARPLARAPAQSLCRRLRVFNRCGSAFLPPQASAARPPTAGIDQLFITHTGQGGSRIPFAGYSHPPAERAHSL